MKKIIVFFIMLVCLTAVSVSAEDEVFTSGNYEYILLENGSASIKSFIGNDEFFTETGITIPGELDGVSVTAICDDAFNGYYMLPTISIPDSVTSIGNRAFRNCQELTTFYIPDSVTSIGNKAFDSCVNLSTINIPDSVTTIEQNPFVNCKRLKTIFISPDHPVFSVIDGALYRKTDKRMVYCPCGEDIVEFNIPDGIEIIGNSAFEDSYYLTKVIIPDSVIEIGNSAFASCTGLTEIIIPDSVTEIGDSAFASCTGLTEITIPNSVKTIGTNPFLECDNIIGFYISEDHPKFMTSDGVLISKSDKRLICYPKGRYDEDYTIPEGIEIIGDHAFDYCSNLTHITIPDSVTSIGNHAFNYCSNLTHITIPDSVTNIGNYAFAYCSGLTDIIIPDSVTSIGNYAFACCSGLTHINIPDSVTSIGDSAFRLCDGLTEITIPDSVTSIGNSVFRECKSLTEINIPDSVTSIGNSAFYECKSLTEINIPDDVTSIGFGAFFDCESLKEINIPDSVTSIGEVAFAYCESLIELIIPERVTCIGVRAFEDCTNLGEVTIPDSVTSIGDNAFRGCRNLILTVNRNSYAAEYCKQNNLNHIFSNADVNNDDLMIGEGSALDEEVIQSIMWNDGSQDTIQFRAERGENYSILDLVLSVNGKEETVSIPGEEYPDLIAVYALDIDCNDSYKNVVVAVIDIDEVYTTHLIAYDNLEIRLIGSISGLPDLTYVPGNGQFGIGENSYFGAQGLGFMINHKKLHVSGSDFQIQSIHAAHMLTDYDGWKRYNQGDFWKASSWLEDGYQYVIEADLRVFSDENMVNGETYILAGTQIAVGEMTYGISEYGYSQAVYKISGAGIEGWTNIGSMRAVSNSQIVGD